MNNIALIIVSYLKQTVTETFSFNVTHDVRQDYNKYYK